MNRLMGLVLLAAGLAVATTARAEYPEKPIRVIVPFGPGTGTDSAARQVFMEIAARTGATIVVENRAGAEGQIGALAAATAAPDGYTVFVTTQTTQAINPAAYKKLQYDPTKQFDPVSGIVKSPQVVLVRNGLPATTIGELIALAKKEPGKLTFGSSNGSSRGGGELFKTMAGVDLLHIPYKTQPQAILDLAGGRLDVVFTDMTTGIPPMQDGSARAIAVTGRARLPSMPQLPTVAEAGVPGFEMGAWVGVFVPAGTPRPIVEKLNGWVHQAVRSEGYQATIRRQSAEAFPGTPEQLAAFQASEIKRWAEIVKAAGMREP